MGNCQASDAAMVMIQHPCGTTDRVYFSVSAREVMEANPGHYVAVFVTPTIQQRTNYSSHHSTNTTTKPTHQRHLKLLRPDDTLQVGNMYRLISFEEMMKEIATKKHVKLSRMMLSQLQKERSKGKERPHHGGKSTSTTTIPSQSEQMTEEEVEDGGMDTSRIRHGGGRWKPRLQTIAEVVGN